MLYQFICPLANDSLIHSYELCVWPFVSPISWLWQNC
jgi:hypothetical protein